MQKENDFHEKKNNRSVCAKEPPVFRQNRQPCPPPYIKNVNLFDGAYIDFETHLV